MLVPVLLFMETARKTKDPNMKDMLEFAREHTGQTIFEAKKETQPSDDKVVQNGKLVDKDKALDAGERPNAARRVKWAVDEPTSDDALKYANKEDWTDNMKEIRKRIRTGLPFFILGHAGWGKTAIIKQIAKKFGYSIITVYLDKALPEDLKGIDVPMEGPNKTVYQETALPAWAAYMLDNPNKKFLLFFDEMNQADPRVMNALMPIVKENTIGGVEIPNYTVAAAGNYHDENEATSELSRPLMERFAPIIKWEDKTPKAWKEYMKHIHSVWDDKVGKDLVDEIEKSCELFSSPRVIDEKLLSYIWKTKQLGEEEWDFYDASDYLKFIKGEGILDPDIEHSRTDEEDLERLADYIDSWMREDNNKKEKENNRSRNSLVSPDWLKEDVKHGMETGWIVSNDDMRYACARENIVDLFVEEDDDEISAEMVFQEVKLNEKKGINFKYETVKDALKDNPHLMVEDQYKSKYGV
jgi:hypothetical protein